MAESQQRRQTGSSRSPGPSRPEAARHERVPVEVHVEAATNRSAMNRPKPDIAAPPGGAQAGNWLAEEFAASAHAMWCIAYSITSNRTLAEDVVQEAVTIALSKQSEFTQGTNFAAWLGKIVRFVALNSARRAHRDNAAATDTNVLERVPSASSASPEQARGLVTGRGELFQDQSSFDDRVTSALATLEPTARACILLRTLLNMPYREVAAALDIPEGTAMSHVHRARVALRELLKDDSPMRDSKGRTR